MTMTENQKRLVIVGATGMVGGYALRYALDHPAVGAATAIGRKPMGLTHPKLKEVLRQDFADCSALAGALSVASAPRRFTALAALRLQPNGHRTRSTGCWK
jgi:N-acetyl-gamma-glutamylphosphate reductase